MESWFSDVGDCDEAMQIYQSYMMFIKCDVSHNEELRSLQKYLTSNYISFLFFITAQMGKIGHWVVLFVPKSFFYGRDTNLKIMVCEPTMPIHPTMKKMKRGWNSKCISSTRKLRSLNSSTSRFCC